MSFDANTRQLSVFTTSGLDVGTHAYSLEVYLAAYPVLRFTKGVTVNFEIEIDSVCLTTEMMAFQVPETVHQVGQPKVLIENALYADSQSLADGGDGYSLCGERTLSTTHSWLTVPA